jgi:hypothetical protein
MASQVIIPPALVSAYLRDPTGPVTRRMFIMGDAVKVRAVSKLKTGFPRDFLGPTIVKRVAMSANGPVVQVGSDHVKTARHVIRGNPLLVFYWEKVGQVVFFRSVNHPGSDFTNYLTKILTESLDAAREALI